MRQNLHRIKLLFFKIFLQTSYLDPLEGWMLANEGRRNYNLVAAGVHLPDGGHCRVLAVGADIPDLCQAVNVFDVAHTAFIVYLHRQTVWSVPCISKSSLVRCIELRAYLGHDTL